MTKELNWLEKQKILEENKIFTPIIEFWYWAHLESSWEEAFNKEENYKESAEEKKERLTRPERWFKERITKNRWVIYWAEDYVWPNDTEPYGHRPSLEKKQFLLKEFYKSKK